jgi:hypothetical protein
VSLLAKDDVDDVTCGAKEILVRTHFNEQRRCVC